MRIVIFPRHHHLVRQQGFYPAISKFRINWPSGFHRSLATPARNEHARTESTAIPSPHHKGILAIPALPFPSCSPLLSQHHILPSRSLHIKSLSFPASHLLAQERTRFQRKMSVLTRRLHSSSRPFYSHQQQQQPTTTSAHGENSDFFYISHEVREAVERNKPVVALESAIITHGMPFPDNIDTAFRLESIIRELGVIPATVGVIKGRVTVGLSATEIERLGDSAKKDRARDSPVVKVSRRDLPFVLAHKLDGGTTVCGTIIAAVKAGIPIFATGGLGGVHRGAEQTFDISADLKELGRNPIAVVSAGVKSILDIGKTLEYMETEGICVAVLQKPDEERAQTSKSGCDDGSSHLGNVPVHRQIGNAKFPSFFTAESEFLAPYTVHSELEAASLVHAGFQFQLNSGILIAIPIPKEHEGAGREIESAIKSALEDAARSSIQGKDMTPFLLGQVNRLTGGESLKANKHLIENNVRSASKIATNLAQLRTESGGGGGGSTGAKFRKKSSGHHQHSNEHTMSSNSYHSSASHSSGSQTRIAKENGSESEIEPVSSSLETLPGQRWSFGRETQSTMGKSTETTGTRGTEQASSKTRTVTYSSWSDQRTTNGTTESRPKHERPVVIGGTSLDLVLAIQENEIVDICREVFVVNDEVCQHKVLMIDYGIAFTPMK